jgi:DNA-directed RNA polymerase subunit N (RpoN/RPB10)
MHVLIRCNCGNCIAPFYTAYVKILQERYEEYLKENDIHIDNVLIVNNDTISMGDLLDELGLFKYCCRTHIIANIVITDIKKLY